MSRILLLLQQAANRRLLAELLALQHEVILPGSQAVLATNFDLCIVDGPGLERFSEELEGHKAREQPGFLPVLLVAAQDSRRTAHQHWECVDELITTPIEKRELWGRVTSLLRARNLSLDLKLRNAELEQANWTKDRFLASMSHELRTPLNAIIGFTGTLLMGLPGPLTADQEKQLRTIQTSAKHLLALINDILDLAKIDSGTVEIQPEPLVCQAIIAEVVATLQPLAAAKGLRLEAALPARDLVLCTDQRALSQILINLINNAIKFTERGGVKVELRQEEGFGDQRIVISVTDSGIGLRPEDQARLFQAFTQVNTMRDRRHEGTGLGLYLSQKLATLLGGQITIQSEYGSGSTFTLTIAER